MSTDRWFEPAENILLTAAGFTKTFRGYLASEMWAAVLNQKEIQEDVALRRDLLETFNYEKFYDNIRQSSEYTARPLASVTEALRKAYQELDDILTGLDTLTEAASAQVLCSAFLRRFAGEGKKRGFFFTLNQDLFVERFYNNDAMEIRIPGVHHAKWFGQLRRGKLDGDYEVTLPNQAKVDEIKRIFWAKGSGTFAYIKLHGSFGWKSQDGSNAMVIGQGKEGMIQKEPLLQWYQSLFEEVLNYRENQKLVVVGYGFRDEHINSVIANALRNRQLKLFIVSPQPPAEFHGELFGLHGANVQPKPRGEDLWNGLCQYWPVRVSDFIYPSRNQLSPQGDAFFRNLRRT